METAFFVYAAQGIGHLHGIAECVAERQATGGEALREGLGVKGGGVEGHRDTFPNVQD